MRKKLSHPGFTIIELLIVMGLITVAAAISLPVTGSLLAQSKLGAFEKDVVRLLREAQSFSQTRKDGQLWGVCFEADKAVLRKNSCSSEGVTEIIYPNDVEVMGLASVFFSLGWALPDNPGVIQIQHQDSSTQLVVNQAGSVFIQ